MKARKIKKREKLLNLQLQFYIDLGLNAKEVIAEVRNGTNPYLDIGQRRHERRVFGHDSPCDCTREQVDALITWNQPSSLWAGGGKEYHQRSKNRVKRKKISK